MTKSIIYLIRDPDSNDSTSITWPLNARRTAQCVCVRCQRIRTTPECHVSAVPAESKRRPSKLRKQRRVSVISRLFAHQTWRTESILDHFSMGPKPRRFLRSCAAREARHAPKTTVTEEIYHRTNYLEFVLSVLSEGGLLRTQPRIFAKNRIFVPSRNPPVAKESRRMSSRSPPKDLESQSGFTRRSHVPRNFTTMKTAKALT